MWLRKVNALVLLLTLQACHIPPGESKPAYKSHLNFTAKVIRIIDGDTMEILYQDHPVKIRLAHIDCPEKRAAQPFGNNAKEALSDLCFGQMVDVKVEKYDRYKRLIAIVVNGKRQIVNQEMIKQGMAWHFKKYSSDGVYAKLEIIAREKKVGLWHDANPIPPWEWRN
ncbi:thermonuclease family protein [Pedobacter rhodius]|uniref:Thermonuclease family protein n=1 Tax=Pedobacter rhodius TaxID=3004098 RepID=A0ABT4L1A1_9SPHI|nr:thermonuclease family protein [Pedobacter sp. SJ11]MCZ4224958.1 thermonuclease family protein [Pedobacter sp. SJ11]